MRVTLTMLKTRVAFLNKKMNRPADYFAGDFVQDAKQGKIKTSVGNFCIDCAYGGYSLHEVTNEAGGVTDVFNIGHIPARDLMNLIYAFEAGMRYAEESEHSK